MPGQSGNPGGRPKGLSRRVRELVGDDGHAIAEYMFSVLNNENERTADRMEAAKWLADRGFGKATLVVDLGVSEAVIQEFLKELSTRGSGGDAHDPGEVLAGVSRAGRVR